MFDFEQNFCRVSLILLNPCQCWRNGPPELAKPIYGYLMPIILAITFIANILIIMVLSKKHMRSPTNLVSTYQFGKLSKSTNWDILYLSTGSHGNGHFRFINSGFSSTLVSQETFLIFFVNHGHVQCSSFRLPGQLFRFPLSQRKIPDALRWLKG